MWYNSTIVGPTWNMKTKGENFKAVDIEFETKVGAELKLLTKEMLDYEYLKDTQWESIVKFGKKVQIYP